MVPPVACLFLQYELGGLVGASQSVFDSRKSRAPSFSIGRSPKAGPGVSSVGPGPGAYTSGSGLGEQHLSGRPSSARIRFGTAPRSREYHEATPSPATYAISGASSVVECGAQRPMWERWCRSSAS